MMGFRLNGLKALAIGILLTGQVLGNTISTILGTGEPGFSGDGGLVAKAQIRGPFGVIRGPDGCLYVCDTYNHCIRKIDKSGIVSTVAGIGGKKGYSGDGGQAVKALLNEPYEVRFDKKGDLYFVEMMNHLIRKVNMRTGGITTVAGTGEKGFGGGRGSTAKAMFNRPHSIQFGPEGDLYVCDIGNHLIRKVSMETGKVSTFCGTGKRRKTKDGGRIAEVDLNGPRAIDVSDDQMWLALREGNAVYRLDLKKGTIHHEAGTGKRGFSGNGGPARLATLSGPKGIAVGPMGNVYLADTESHSVRMIDRATGKLELIAGDGKAGDGPEGNDPRKCRMDRLHGIFVDADGAIYVGDTNTHRIRVIRP
jgi:DNA-binding beta-propeller fold protein YncE